MQCYLPLLATTCPPPSLSNIIILHIHFDSWLSSHSKRTKGNWSKGYKFNWPSTRGSPGINPPSTTALSNTMKVFSTKFTSNYSWCHKKSKAHMYIASTIKTEQTQLNNLQNPCPEIINRKMQQQIELVHKKIICCTTNIRIMVL